MHQQMMHGLIIGGRQKMGQSSLPKQYWIKLHKSDSFQEIHNFCLVQKKHCMWKSSFLNCSQFLHIFFGLRTGAVVLRCQKRFSEPAKLPSIFFFRRITMLHPRQSLQGQGGAERRKSRIKSGHNVVLWDQTWRLATGLMTLTSPN